MQIPAYASHPIENLLGHLEGVRKAGKEWKAICPAHDDHDPSLSISEGKDGCALVKCRTGCRTEDVLAAIGLGLKDLYVQKPRAGMTAEERAAAEEGSKRAKLRPAINDLGLEADIVSIAAWQILAGKPLSAEDTKRLQLAANRVNDAKGALRAPR